MANADRWLKVGRSDLAEALSVACTGVRSAPAELRFDFKDGVLTIAGPGAEQALDAQGVWAGTALVRAQLMKTLANRLPEADPIRVEMQDRRIQFERLSFDARWLDIAPRPVDVTVRATSLEILAAAVDAPKARIMASPWSAGYDKAKADLVLAISRALTHLKPYGVTHADLETVTEAAIRRAAKRPHG